MITLSTSLSEFIYSFNCTSYIPVKIVYENIEDVRVVYEFMLIEDLKK